MPLQDFNEAVTVITGGASGIGLATAQALRDAGAHVVLADINTNGLEKAASQLRQQSSKSQGEILTVPTDVTQEAQVHNLMQQAQTRFGGITLVVCSAGIGQGGPIDEFSSSAMQRMMNINFMGTYNSVQAALPTMRKQQSSHFVLISSVAGKLAVPMLTAYCATKWAVRGFSAALRAELYGTNIGVTTVYPAWVDTPMIHQESETFKNMHIKAELTPQTVASEILQAVLENKTDLTLAPNHDIAKALEMMQENQEQAEQLSGMVYARVQQKQ